MADYCNQTIGATDRAGQLVLDFSRMSGRTFRACAVVVEPMKVSSIHPGTDRVLFYFTDFRLASFCSDMNVTIYDDGDGRNVLPGFILVT